MTTKAPMPADFASHWSAALSQLVAARETGERGGFQRAGASVRRAMRTLWQWADSEHEDLALRLAKELAPAKDAFSAIQDARYQAWLLRGFK